MTFCNTQRLTRVWKKKKKQFFIDSILLSSPLPFAYCVVKFFLRLIFIFSSTKIIFFDFMTWKWSDALMFRLHLFEKVLSCRFLSPNIWRNDEIFFGFAVFCADSLLFVGCPFRKMALGLLALLPKKIPQFLQINWDKLLISHLFFELRKIWDFITLNSIQSQSFWDISVHKRKKTTFSLCETLQTIETPFKRNDKRNS